MIGNAIFLVFVILSQNNTLHYNMDKIHRLQLLRQIGQRHAEREVLAFTGFAPTVRDVLEEVSSMDTFIEETRERGRTSDEG